MPESALTECLHCGYDLTGLPPQHRCPECGQPYDAATRVWRPRTRRGRLFVLLCTIPALVSAGERAAAIAHSLSHGLPVRSADLIFGLAALVLALFIVWLVRNMTRQRLFVAITRQTLYVGAYGGTIVVPWAEVIEIGGDVWRGVSVKRRSKRLTRTILFVLDTKADVSQFLKAASEAMTRVAREQQGGNVAEPTVEREIDTAKQPGSRDADNDFRNPHPDARK